MSSSDLTKLWTTLSKITEFWLSKSFFFFKNWSNLSKKNFFYEEYETRRQLLLMKIFKNIFSTRCMHRFMPNLPICSIIHLFCKSCAPEIVFVTKQFHVRKSYKTSESILSCSWRKHWYSFSYSFLGLLLSDSKRSWIQSPMEEDNFMWPVDDCKKDYKLKEVSKSRQVKRGHLLPKLVFLCMKELN